MQLRWAFFLRQLVFPRCSVVPYVVEPMKTSGHVSEVVLVSLRIALVLPVDDDDDETWIVLICFVELLSASEWPFL